MSVLNTFQERLYLSKGGAADIYVNDCQNLRRNQIDSLRALFNLFTKKLPGAILNNASDSGKTVTVVSFIEAIQKLLSDPVLILCNHDHEIQYWNEIFSKWTKYSEDNIAVQSTNPYLKKCIFIQKSTELANSFIRRNWGVLVLKDDEITKDISKMVFNAQFKIWMTTVDVFRDLKMLESLGKFINPKMNINIEDFKIKNKNVIDKIKTLVLLQSFAEEFVVRTDDLKSILQKGKESTKNISSLVTKKNKDPTGTKIKKSKRKLCEDSTSVSIKNKKTSIENNGNEVKDIPTNDNDDEDSPSVLNLKSCSRKNSTQILNPVTNHDTQHENDDVNGYNGNKRSEFFNDKRYNDETDVDSRTHSQPLSDHTTQCPTDESEREANITDTESSQVNLMYSEDVEMDIRNEENASSNSTNIAIGDKKMTKDFKEVECDEPESEVYEKDTIDLNTNRIEMKSDIEDVRMKIKDDQNEQKTVPNPSISDEINMKTENVKESSFDHKMNELEAQTLLKFKGSILDSIF